MKMDLHLSDFREMRTLKGTLTLHILQLWALVGCLFAEINSFQARGLAVLILRQKNHKSVA